MSASFDDFKKLELRVGKIIECEPVEGSDKLYRLSVRIGAETRTLAAGLAEHYAPDELLGRLVVVVANLEPRTIRGIESQGMLLAADDGAGKVALLTVIDEISDGATVR
jgi:methionyl-tRNA synthetase